MEAWRKREGVENAARIVEQSGARGTAMHKILEKWILEEGYMDMTTVGQEAHNMAKQVIEQGLCNVSEYYGSTGEISKGQKHLKSKTEEILKKSIEFVAIIF